MTNGSDNFVLSLPARERFRELQLRYSSGVKPAGQYVFGYGSLLERSRPHRPSDAGDLNPGPADLRGFRRTWNVAMDNMQTIPGYKYYVERATGERRDWFVTFLNVVPDPRSCVNGVLFAVTDERLAQLDERERNYERVEVSAEVSPAVDGRAWLYIGSAAAVRRFEAGRRSNRAVICRDYYQRVADDFAALGACALDRFRQLTDSPPCPVIDVLRIDLQADGGAVPSPAAAQRPR